MDKRYNNIINPLVAEYLVDHYKSLDEKFEEFRNKAVSDNVPIILEDAESLILNILRIKKPERILEIGTAVGYSACTFAKGTDAHIDTVEINEDIAETARDNIKKMGFEDRITVFCGDGEEIISSFENTYDFIFIDASKSHYKRFFDAAINHAAKDALVICDNVLFQGRVVSDEYDPSGRYKTNIRKMREFIEYITNLSFADTSIISVGDGLSITVLRGE